MKRRLTILRHGKAQTADGSFDDFDRPLTPRGISDVSAVAKKLLEEGLRFDLVLSSPAVRALSTAKIFAETFGVENLLTDVGIYEAYHDTLLQTVQALPQEFSSVLLVGHNPGLSYLANMLLPQGNIVLATSGVVCLEFEAPSWNAIEEASARLVFTLEPKSL